MISQDLADVLSGKFSDQPDADGYREELRSIRRA
jgi:hypothetical protein